MFINISAWIPLREVLIELVWRLGLALRVSRVHQVILTCSGTASPLLGWTYCPPPGRWGVSAQLRQAFRGGGDALCSAVGALSPWAIWIPAFFLFAKRTVKLGNHNIGTFLVEPSPGFSVIHVGREGPSVHHWESRVEGELWLTWLSLSTKQRVSPSALHMKAFIKYWREVNERINEQMSEGTGGPWHPKRSHSQETAAEPGAVQIPGCGICSSSLCLLCSWCKGEEWVWPRHSYGQGVRWNARCSAHQRVPSRTSPASSSRQAKCKAAWCPPPVLPPASLPRARSQYFHWTEKQSGEITTSSENSPWPGLDFPVLHSRRYIIKSIIKQVVSSHRTDVITSHIFFSFGRILTLVISTLTDVLQWFPNFSVSENQL